jgi:hypothetical protein
MTTVAKPPSSVIQVDASAVLQATASLSLGFSFPAGVAQPAFSTASFV